MGAVVAFALLLASPTEALRPNTTPKPCAGHRFEVPTWAVFTQRVWDKDRWRRGQPKATTIAAERQRLHCAPARSRPAMKHRWRRGGFGATIGETVAPSS